MKTRILLAVLASAILSAAQYIPVQVRLQEKNNWHGHAAVQSILEYYGTYLSQTTIANYATPGQLAHPIPLYGEGTDFVRLGIDLNVAHFAGLQSTNYDRSLSWAEIISHLSAGRIIAVRVNSMWGWRIIIIRGVASGQMLHLIDPWPSHGALVMDYSTLLFNGTETWDQSIVITSPRGTPPARPINELDIPKVWPVYAFDQARVNDGAVIYRDPTTTTLYGQIGSGCQNRAYACPPGSYGINIGVNAKVGNIHSSWHVLLRDRANIYGSIYKPSTVDVTQQNNVYIQGTINNSDQAYRGFGWGSIDFTGVPQSLIMIEPDQPTVNLAPGKYWGYHIKARSTLRLTAGDYFFNTLNLDEANLVLDVTQGPIRVYVATNLLWRGTQSFVGGNASRFLLGYLGTQTLYLEKNSYGTFLAPISELVIGQSQKYFEGMFVGKSVTVHQYSTVRFRGFVYGN